MLIDTGNYLIHFFNAYGQRMRDFDKTAGCLTEAEAEGEGVLALFKVADDPKTLHSFTVDRRVYNSIDNHDRW